MKLNEKIVYCRKKMGLSQEELASRVNVSRQAVSKWELGDAMPEVDKILTLARVFQVSTDELLGYVCENADVQEAEESVCDAQAVDSMEEITYRCVASEEPQETRELPRALGFLGKMVKRWGYITGYIVSLEGLGVTVVGIIARYLFALLFSVDIHAPSMIVTGVSSADFPVELIEESLGIARSYEPLSNVPLMCSNIIILIGIVMIVAGLLMAWYLKRHFARK